MKIKRHFYCITDKNNKPDFRFLFESPRDAKNKIKQIKNSTQGETIIFSENKRDFFIDGINKNFIDPYKKISLKKGCWNTLKVQKVSLLENVDPENVFSSVVKSQENEYSFTKEYVKEEAQVPIDLKKKSTSIPNPFLSFDWETSFLRTRTFSAAMASLFAITVLTVFSISYFSDEKITKQIVAANNAVAEKTIAMQTQVLGKSDEKYEQELNDFMLSTLKDFENIKQEELEGEIKRIVAGSPMEQMVPYIAQKDRKVAAFLVGIAKKESNLGRRVPVLNGQDCYNYWGYRGIRDRMGTGGHTCFDSPKDAVDTVARRLGDLVQSDIDTPKEMVIWKCGSTCAGHSPYSVQKWIDDVNLYFSKMIPDTTG